MIIVLFVQANESLNWILGDPDIKEAFRNSSIIGSSVVGSLDFNTGGTNQLGKRSSHSKSPSSREKKEKYSSQEKSSSSLSNLFSDEEERDLLGIGFFTIWEAGLLLSGYGGNGIVLSRNIMTGQWSGPVAVGVSGVGAGVLAGASMKTVVYLIYDYFTLKSIIGTDGGLIFGAGAGATVGTWTTETTGKQSAYITSPKMLRTAGMGSNVALCRGLAGMYGAMSVEAGICKCRDRINNQFYGKEITGSDILLSGETIEIPNNTTGVSNYQAKRLLEKIHSKLERLCDREGSDHGSKIYNHSSNAIGYNPDDGSSDNSDEINQNNESEDVRATLEKLYADESFDEPHEIEEPVATTSSSEDVSPPDVAPVTSNE